MSQDTSILAGFLYDEITSSVKPFWDIIDPQTKETLYNDRLNVCKQCDQLIFDNSINICGLCHCGLEHKLKIIFPLDEDNKAFNNVHYETKEKYYVCKLKKW